MLQSIIAMYFEIKLAIAQSSKFYNLWAVHVADVR